MSQYKPTFEDRLDRLHQTSAITPRCAKTPPRRPQSTVERQISLIERQPTGIYKALRDATLGQAFRASSPFALHAFRLFPALRPDHVAALAADMDAEPCHALLMSALQTHDAPALPWKRRLQRSDLMTFCLDAVLPKVDRAGMAYSVEARPPLLDHRIVEWGLSHPITEGFDGTPKGALREILKARTLGFLLDEPKRGFSLKLSTPPDRRYAQGVIRGAVGGLGVSPRWKSVLHRGVERRAVKRDTLLFLSLWQAQNGPRHA